jgi:hypothetical protein
LVATQILIASKPIELTTSCAPASPARSPLGFPPPPSPEDGASWMIIVVTPFAPALDFINQPGCNEPSASLQLTGLPSSDWTVTKYPGGSTIQGSGVKVLISNLKADSDIVNKVQRALHRVKSNRLFLTELENKMQVPDFSQKKSQQWFDLEFDKSRTVIERLKIN